MSPPDGVAPFYLIQSVPQDSTLKNILAPIRFIRDAMRGHGLRPWRSPYLRWRIETYSGIPADTINARIFWKFMFAEKGRMLHFLRWTAEIASHKEAKKRS